jgi:fibronectin-binding autotransporter adhesin
MLAGTLPLTTASLFANNTWDGGGADNLWGTAANWGGDTLPGYGTLTFAGTTRTSNTDNSITSMNQLSWTGASTWTAGTTNSTTLSLFDNGGTQAKIENNTGGAGFLVTINLPITFAANNSSPPNPFGEINAVTGDLTFANGGANGSGTLTVNGSSVNGIKLFGSGHTVNFNNTVTATGKWFGITTSGTGNTINIGGSFTASDFYLMNGGTLNLASGGNLNSTAIRLGGDFGTTGNQDQTKSGSFNLTVAGGGQSFTGTINSVQNNTSNALAVNAQNTSGTDTLSGSIFLNSSLTFQNSSGGTLSITSATFDLRNNSVLTFDIAGTATVSNAITATGDGGSNPGGGSLLKKGAGTLTLNTASSYTGGTTIQAGTLTLGVTNALPSTSGSLTVSGGTLEMNNKSQTVVGLSDGGSSTGVITNNGSTSTTSTLTLNDTGSDSFGGQIKDGTKVVALTKTGAGTLTLSNSNAFSGGLTLSGGTLTGTNGGALGTGLITVNGANTTLNLRNNADTTFNNNGLTLNTGATGTTTISADQATTGNTNHTLTLSGTVSLANGTNVGVTTGNGYTLALGPVVVTGSSTPSTQFTGAGTGTLSSLTGSSSATTSTANFNNSGTITITGNVLNGGGALSLTKGTAAGTLILQGTSSNYTGSTSITNGTIRTAVATNGFGNTSGISIGAAGILDLRNDSSVAFSNGTTNYPVSTSASGATINVDNNNSAVTGNTLTIGALSLGAHTLNITGANNYSLATGAVTLSGAGTISANSANVTLGAITNGGNRLTVTGISNTTLGGAVSGTGDLLKQGTGTLTFNASSPSWSPTTNSNTVLFVDNGTVLVGSGGDIGATDGSTTGRIAFGSSNSGSAGSISLLLTTAGTTLANPIDSRFFTGVSSAKTIGGSNTSGTVTFSGALTLHDTTTLTAASGGTVAFSGVVATGTAGSPYAGEAVNTANVLFNAGPGIIITGPGTVEYDNTNTYSTETYVKSGTLQFNGASASANNSTIRLGDDVASSTATVNIATAAGGTTIASTINPRAGAGGTKTISATNTSGTNTYSGHIGLDTNVNVVSTNAGGTLAITQARANSTDTLTGFDIKSFTATFSGAGDTNVSGTIYNSAAGAGNENAGTGNIVKAGTGTLTLSASNTFKGTTTINANGGTLNAAAAGALGSISSITVNNGGTLGLTGSSGVTNRINNSAGVTLAGGTFNLGGLSEGAAGTTGVGALTLSSTSTIDFGSAAATNLIQFASVGTHVSSQLLITNWQGTAGQANGGDQLLFAGNSSSFNYAQSDVFFNGVAGFATQDFGAYFEVFEPIPEPGTWLASALAFIALFATHRKRLARIMEAENKARNFPDNL